MTDDRRPPAAAADEDLQTGENLQAEAELRGESNKGGEDIQTFAGAATDVTFDGPEADSDPDAPIENTLRESLKALSDAERESPAVQAILAKLDEAEAAVTELQARNDQLEADAAANSIHRGARPVVGEGGGYVFVVGPVNRAKHSALPVKRLTCCDESEAIRYYVISTDNPPGSGKQVDPVKVALRAVITDNRRAKLTQLKQRISQVRLKLQNGAPLTTNDQKIYSQYQQEIDGLPYDENNPFEDADVQDVS